jgi:hypothetical protein
LTAYSLHFLLLITYWTLTSFLSEPDVRRFPVSVLVASALCASMVGVLVEQYQSSAARRRSNKTSKCHICTLLPANRALAVNLKHKARAMQAAAKVEKDITDILNISQADLDECKKWIEDLYC